MEINWTEIIISLCSLIITGVIVPFVGAKIKETKNKASNETLNTVNYWADVAVRWAKQWLQSETGEKKKVEVMNFLTGKLQSLGIEMTEEDIDKIVESAYEQIKEISYSSSEVE